MTAATPAEGSPWPLLAATAALDEPLRGGQALDADDPARAVLHRRHPPRQSPADRQPLRLAVVGARVARLLALLYAAHRFAHRLAPAA